MEIRPIGMQPPQRPQSERGAALLVVLLLSMILVPFASEFAFQIQLEAKTAQNVIDQLAIDNALLGQYEIVLARLRYDGPGNETDSYDDAWNDDELRERSVEDTGVTLRTTVWDEQGKLNIVNLGTGDKARREVWKQRLKRLIEKFREDTKWPGDSYAEELADAIANYVSGDSNARGNVPKPNTVGDRPILLLDELYFASEIIEKEKVLEDRREGEDVAPGLHRYITVYGTGKLNLNTAELVLLEAIFPSDPDVAQAIVDKREGGAAEEDEGFVGDTGGDEAAVADEDESLGGDPFTEVNQLRELDSWTEQVAKNNNVDINQDFDVKSNYFSMRIVGQTNNTRRDELFVVQRVPGSEPQAEIEGFRHLLHQERTDPLEENPLGEEED